jgi:penicillin-binding protein 1A
VSVLDNLTRVSAPGDPEWHPRTAEGDQPDALTLRAALLESNNPAAADLQQRIGTRAVLKLASDAGLSNLPDVPSLALGSGLVSPLELTSAFTAFAADGQVSRPRGMIAVFDSGGRQVYDRPIEQEPILTPEVAFQMTSMLRDVIERGTGAPARALGVRGPVAGKTGTTNDYNDAWFVGYSTSVVAGVWVGFDQPSSIGREAYGARVALPIWADFMKRVARQLPARDFAVPASLRAEELCSESYLQPVEGCPTYIEYFKSGDTVPSRLCPIHRGTLKQRATRAIDGFFRGLGSRIANIFRR